ncbi:MAG TPA: PEFG-CTERM sorting domain-containing protein [Candidatus Nitrosotalea sp.]|nr:PEFG-CTERM sorting domain-containing protein [Candidatus Nitrosotalea sp.]
MSEPVFTHHVFANSSVTVTTDKSFYIFGDTIVISGTVKTAVPGNTLTISILDPYSNQIQTMPVTVASDGSYTDTIGITGSMWKSGGVYTVLSQYGSEIPTQTTFSYMATTAPINDVFPIQIPGQQTFDVPYTISGGSVVDMYVTPTNFMLSVSIQSTNYGSITLSLPRSLIDSKASDGSDDLFGILVDGVDVQPHKEQVTANERVLTIQFLQGTKNIQIIGTRMASPNVSAVNTTSQNLTTNQSVQITNMSQVIHTVPEFSSGVISFVIALITIVTLGRIVFIQSQVNR